MIATRLPVGELLREYRLRAGLTQRELATASGISEREISDLERGVRNMPRARTLTALAATLRLSQNQHKRLIAATLNWRDHQRSVM